MVKEPPPFTPAVYELPDITSLQALQDGRADAEQQKRALAWIINNACGTYDLEYRTDPRDHAFTSGRRFVGLQLVKMLKLNPMMFKKEK